MLEGIRSLLETVFGTVVMVADEHSLIEAIEGLGPAVVVLDLSLSHSARGANVVSRTLKRYPNQRLIALSVHDEPEAVEAALSAGARAFVLKRTAASDLLPAVEAVLAGGTYVSPGGRKYPARERAGSATPGEKP
jgi:DNA-binding NarL/FixJ family response regulator